MGRTYKFNDADNTLIIESGRNTIYEFKPGDKVFVRGAENKSISAKIVSFYESRQCVMIQIGGNGIAREYFVPFDDIIPSSINLMSSRSKNFTPRYVAELILSGKRILYCPPRQFGKTTFGRKVIEELKKIKPDMSFLSADQPQAKGTK